MYQCNRCVIVKGEEQNDRFGDNRSLHVQSHCTNTCMLSKTIMYINKDTHLYKLYMNSDNLFIYFVFHNILIIYNIYITVISFKYAYIYITVISLKSAVHHYLPVNEHLCTNTLHEY